MSTRYTVRISLSSRANTLLSSLVIPLKPSYTYDYALELVKRFQAKEIKFKVG